MFCIKCGKGLPEEANFCFACGAPVNYVNGNVNPPAEAVRKPVKEYTVYEYNNVAHRDTQGVLLLTNVGLYFSYEKGFFKKSLEKYFYQHKNIVISNGEARLWPDKRGYLEISYIDGNQSFKFINSSFFGSDKKAALEAEKWAKSINAITYGKKNTVINTPAREVYEQPYNSDAAEDYYDARYVNEAAVRSNLANIAHTAANFANVLFDLNIQPKTDNLFKSNKNKQTSSENSLFNKLENFLSSSSYSDDNDISYSYETGSGASRQSNTSVTRETGSGASRQSNNSVTRETGAGVSRHTRNADVPSTSVVRSAPPANISTGGDTSYQSRHGGGASSTRHSAQ